MTSLATPRRSRILQFPIDESNARDSLNLCEFPLALLSDRAPAGLHELTFADTVWDDAEKRRVERVLQISAPSTYGLPTAKDDEVLLALIQLTELVNQFQSPDVAFTRYELIRLLGWNQGGKSYHRVRESLARWKSVTLNYQNAWRDHAARTWKSELFSILDNVTICEAENGRGSDQMNLPLSSFRWNRVFFESMQARYYKKLDYGFLKRLRTPTAKRLYRFLDKRFGLQKRRWEFELREFAFEHIGLSRSYDTGKIKEKLQPAIEELEETEFLRVMPRDERYSKNGRDWRISFERRSAQSNESAARSPKQSLIDELAQRGISPQPAAELVETHAEQDIMDKIDQFDWLMDRTPDSVRNPAGYLAQSIREGFQAPAGYQSRAARENAAKKREAMLEGDRKKKQAEQAKREQEQEQRDRIQAIRSELSRAELQALEERAIAEASEEQQAILRNPRMRRIQIDLLVDRHLSLMGPRPPG